MVVAAANGLRLAANLVLLLRFFYYLALHGCGVMDKNTVFENLHLYQPSLHWFLNN